MEIKPTMSALDEKERESILKRFRRKTIMEHMLGPFGSILFHVLVIVCAIKFMVFKAVDKQTEIEVMVVEPDAVELEEFEKELEKMEELQDMTDMVAPPDVQMNVDAPAPSEAPGPQSDDTSMDIADLNILSDSSPLVMKGLFAGRSQTGRAAGLKGYGGRWGEITEKSVIRALEWLKRNQLPEGSWAGQKEAMTGLALLTFLAHGETTSSKDYGPTVEKAIRYLVSAQKEDGIFVGYTQQGSYAHAIATYAISEAYGLTRIPDLKTVMERAATVIVKGQQPGGSWDYNYKKEARWDTSVAGWNIQALKAAYIAGAEVPGLHEAMEKAAGALKMAQSAETGRFGYSSVGAGSDGVTAVGTLCLQLLGYAKDPAVKNGLNAMNGYDCNWQKPLDWPMYAWYYVTQAKFHSGGQDWSTWNNKFAPELTKNQNEDGSWTSAGANLQEGAHGKEVNLGPVYATTLAALTLQVYYRFLPTYKPIEVKEEVKPKDDVSIEII